MNERSGKSDAEYTLAILPGTDIAVFHWVGPITLDDRVENLERMSEFCSEQDIKKLIIDGRDQVNETDLLDSYTFGAKVPMAFRGLFVAVVHRPDDETLKFIETVAFNRGSGTQAFLTMDEAVSWLESM